MEKSKKISQNITFFAGISGKKEISQNYYPMCDKGERCSDNRGCPKNPRQHVDPELDDAVAHKTRKKGRVVKVERKIVFRNESRIQSKYHFFALAFRIFVVYLQENFFICQTNGNKLANRTEPSQARASEFKES